MLTLTAASCLKGTVDIPGDKSISHRAVMFGAISSGTTRVSHFLSGADCLSTVDCFRRLGVQIDFMPENGEVIVYGKGMRSLSPVSGPEAGLYTGNSGTTTRIISGILAPQAFDSRLSGDASINKRPMKRIMEPLSGMGADIRSLNNNGCAPLIIHGKQLHGITYHSPVASAQVKSAVLCAGLYADSPTTVIEPALSRDHTERMLSLFGADIRSENTSATVHPAEELYAADILVPGDISSAAYFIAAALLVPGSEVLIRNVGINPTRAGILKIAKQMGADITYLNENSSGEPTADLLVRSCPLKAAVIEGDIIPALIDEIPVLAVMAACAEGTTVIRNAAELKVKESNRIETVAENLRAMAVAVTPTEDGMIIEGGHGPYGSKPLAGAQIHTHLDHRIAMSFAVASLIAQGATVLDDENCVDISYPTFFRDLESLKV